MSVRHFYMLYKWFIVITKRITLYLFFLQLSPAYGGSSASSPGYSEGRSNWQSGPSGPGGHGPGPGPGPGSPGQANSSAPASQPSPQPSQPPSHSPGPGPGMPPSPQHQSHQGFPSRPAPPTTPNAHGPDAAVSFFIVQCSLTFYFVLFRILLDFILISFYRTLISGFPVCSSLH